MSVTKVTLEYLFVREAVSTWPKHWGLQGLIRKLESLCGSPSASAVTDNSHAIKPTAAARAATTTTIVIAVTVSVL